MHINEQQNHTNTQNIQIIAYTITRNSYIYDMDYLVYNKSIMLLSWLLSTNCMRHIAISNSPRNFVLCIEIPVASMQINYKQLAIKSENNSL